MISYLRGKIIYVSGLLKKGAYVIIDVEGIGPRSALNILDKAEIKDIQNAVISNSPDTLEKMSGIGKKTAEKIVLGLKDSIQKISDGKKEENYDSDAFDALISLGFSYDQARSSLSQVSKDLSVEK